MRERVGAALILRLPAPCRVATQGLPASARLCASGRIGPGCALTRARHCPPPLLNAAPTARVPRGCPSGQRARFVSLPAAGACCGRDVFALIHSRVWRSARSRRGPPSPTPRPAPANAFASLSPPRQALSLHFANPSRAAAFRVRCHPTDFHPATTSLFAVARQPDWFLRSPTYLQRAPVNVSPGQLPRIRMEEVGAVEIGLPPLAEQRAIAARLDAELGATAALRGSLETKLKAVEKLPATLLREVFGGGEG